MMFNFCWHIPSFTEYSFITIHYCFICIMAQCNYVSEISENLETFSALQTH